MGSIDDKFTIKTLIFCLLLFITITLAHSLALVIKGSQEHNQQVDYIESLDVTDKIKQEMLDNIENESKIDYLDILTGMGDIILGLDLPFPFSLILAIVNSILLILIVFILALLIKAWLPFI
jgi:hypothetical protein